MVRSMRFWALASGILEEDREQSRVPCATTSLGRALLADNGWDPWLEDSNSLWLLHWQFASLPDRTTTWYWVFNHCRHTNFDRGLLVDSLNRFCSEQQVKRVALATVKRDVECFIRTYVEKTRSSSKADTMECPLTELSLLRSVGHRDRYQFARSPRPTLSPTLFAFATVQFWQRSYPNVQTLSLDALFYKPGSPGRVFLLDEESVLDFAAQLESITDGTISWSETAGLRQLISRSQPRNIDPMLFLHRTFHQPNRKTAVA